MILIGKELKQYASLPTDERINALKRIIPLAAAEESLQQCARREGFCRRLPGCFMVWFVIGMGLFSGDSYRQVFRWIQPFRREVEAPERSTICEARQRLGVAPLRRLMEGTVQLLARPETPGGYYCGMRLMAVDGFLLSVPDSAANDRAFGRGGNQRGRGAFPQVRVLALCETGTHVMWRCLIKPVRCGEVTMAHHVLRSLQPDMLLLWDRNFFGYQTLQEVRQTQAQLLARVKNCLIFQPIRHFPDGSFEAKAYPSAAHRKRDEGGVAVRIIEYTLDDPTRPGRGEKHRLVTTLLDAAAHPAETLILLYHERWEEELTFDELKTHQQERPVLRSQTPGGVVQEIYGLLLAHYVVRSLMFQTASREGIDPQRLSFTHTIKVLRCRLPEVRKSARGLRTWHRNLLDEITEEILPPRRNRINPRVIKKKMSHWEAKKLHHRNYPQPTQQFRECVKVLC